MQLQLIKINVYYLEIKYNEQELTAVAKFTKADLPAMFLSLLLLNTYSSRMIFWILDAY